MVAKTRKESPISPRTDARIRDEEDQEKYRAEERNGNPQGKRVKEYSRKENARLKPRIERGVRGFLRQKAESREKGKENNAAKKTQVK